ncbi:DMT family transporter [Spirosoma sp.]|uniref:DMT family transporter n=1 Tax=Spirosoma sp. TaxID=1899569 RepID=UPI003B3A58F0
MEQTTISWVCLLGAGVCQAAWTYSLKFMRIVDIKALRWHTFYKPDGGLLAIAPWVGYILFGAINSILLAMAMRTIATSTAFAVWMALSLIAIKAVDIFWLKQGWSYAELFFTLLITIGIIGLKMRVSS